MIGRKTIMVAMSTGCPLASWWAISYSQPAALVMLSLAIVMNVEVCQTGVIILFMPQEMLFIQQHMMGVMAIKVGHQWQHHMFLEL